MVSESRSEPWQLLPALHTDLRLLHRPVHTDPSTPSALATPTLCTQPIWREREKELPGDPMMLKTICQAHLLVHSHALPTRLPPHSQPGEREKELPEGPKMPERRPDPIPAGPGKKEKPGKGAEPEREAPPAPSPNESPASE